MKDHLHSGVLLVDEHRVVGAVVQEDAEALRIEIVLLRYLERALCEERGGGDQGEEETGGESVDHK